MSANDAPQSGQQAECDPVVADADCAALLCFSLEATYFERFYLAFSGPP